MKCEKCGAIISDQSTKCSYCGEPQKPQHGSVPKKRKKSRGWIIVVLGIIMVAFVINIIVQSDSDSGNNSDYNNSYNNDYNNDYNNGDSYVPGNAEEDSDIVLPSDLKKYILEDCYSLDELSYDRKGEKTLNVQEIIIEDRSVSGNSGTFICTVELEDEYIKKTAYVTLYATKYGSGWIADSWEETRSADVKLKYKPDVNYIKNYFSYKNITVTQDYLNVEAGTCNYAFTVNDRYTYATYSGSVSLSAQKNESFSYTFDLPVYGWYYQVQENINITWNVSGLWKLSLSNTGANATVRVNSLSSPIYNSSTGEYVGDYYGSAYYYNPSWYGQPYETDYDYSDGSGNYRISGGNDPKTAKLQIDGHGSYFANCSIVLEFTCDTMRAYLDGEECYVTKN